MPRIPLKQYGQQLANQVMTQYNPNSPDIIIREITNWIDRKRIRDCMHISVGGLFQNTNARQRRMILKYAKEHARELRKNKESAYPDWKPLPINDMFSTEEPGYDIWDS